MIKNSNPMNLSIPQRINTLKNQKKLSLYFFLVVRTEETFSSQDQKLVETTNL